MLERGGEKGSTYSEIDSRVSRALSTPPFKRLKRFLQCCHQQSQEGVIAVRDEVTYTHRPKRRYWRTATHFEDDRPGTTNNGDSERGCKEKGTVKPVMLHGILVDDTRRAGIASRVPERRLAKSIDIVQRCEVSLTSVTMKFIYVILGLFAVASAQLQDGEHAPETTATVNMNEIVDLMRPSISKYIVFSKLDPLKLPNVSQSFWAVTPTLPPFPSKGMIDLKSGLLHKLSSLERYGDAILSYQNKTLHFNTGIQFSNLFAEYDYAARIFVIVHNGQLKTSVANVRTKVEVTIDVGNYTLTLNNLKVLSVGSIKVTFKGNKALDWLINPLSKAIVPIFKDSLIKSIEKSAANAIQKNFDKINAVLPRPDTEDEDYEMDETQIAENLKSFLNT
ncbi:hypothetical protein KM043_014117 [Ampulex compressa]|nr:hypothetical protein KM043_014117 [Ampulex compressa]